METAFDGHGGEVETSIALHLFPDLVHPERYFAATEPAVSTGLDRVEFTNDWTMKWPRALSGDPRPATAAKGKVFYESCVERLADAYRSIKNDVQVAAFTGRYQEKRMHPGDPSRL
jgi:creatinine amidohydrolase